VLCEQVKLSRQRGGGTDASNPKPKSANLTKNGASNREDPVKFVDIRRSN
jgi:hypothetical protein